MGADIPPERFQPMRSAYLSLIVSSIEEAERVYAVLSDGGEIFMQMQETFFAFRFGMLRDKFGSSWMILHERQRPYNARQRIRCGGAVSAAWWSNTTTLLYRQA